MSLQQADIGLTAALIATEHHDAPAWLAKVVDQVMTHRRGEAVECLNVIANMIRRGESEDARLCSLGLWVQLTEPVKLKAIEGGRTPRKRRRKPPKLRVLQGGAP